MLRDLLIVYCVNQVFSWDTQRLIFNLNASQGFHFLKIVSQKKKCQQENRTSMESNVGLKILFFYYLHWSGLSYLFNVLFHKMFVVGVTGLSRKDRRKYEDWKAQSLGGRVGVKIFLMIFIYTT